MVQEENTPYIQQTFYIIRKMNVLAHVYISIKLQEIHIQKKLKN